MNILFLDWYQRHFLLSLTTHNLQSLVMLAASMSDLCHGVDWLPSNTWPCCCWQRYFLLGTLNISWGDLLKIGRARHLYQVHPRHLMICHWKFSRFNREECDSASNLLYRGPRKPLDMQHPNSSYYLFFHCHWACEDCQWQWGNSMATSVESDQLCLKTKALVNFYIYTDYIYNYTEQPSSHGSEHRQGATYNATKNRFSCSWKICYYTRCPSTCSDT